MRSRPSRDGSDLLTPDEWQWLLDHWFLIEGGDTHSVLAGHFGEEKAEEIHDYVIAARAAEGDVDE